MTLTTTSSRPLATPTAAWLLLLAPLLTAGLPAQMTWRTAGFQPPPRCGTYACFDQQRGRMTIFAGETSPAGWDYHCWQLEDSNWIRMSVVTLPGRSHGASCEAQGGLGLLFGGRNHATSGLFAETLRWNRDVARFEVLAPATSPPARYLTAMAYDTARQRAVLFGGSGASGHLGDTWEWDGNNWLQRSPAQRPANRANHAMAYDQARGRTVLYGGHNGASLGDTWTWDGTSWSNVSPPPGPDRRHNLMLAYDPDRYVVVMFGGKNDAGVVNNTLFEWNGSSWQAGASPGVRPSARELSSLVYDRQRRRMTLSGGAGQGSTLLQDTWTFDGQTWTQLLPDGRPTLVEPPAREYAAMGFSEQAGKTVLFGGVYRQGRRFVPLTDTWESSGHVWQQRNTSVSPPPSYAGTGAILRGTGAFCYLPGHDPLGTSFNQQWVWGDTGWTGVALEAARLDNAQQVLGSLQSSHFGWVLVRLATTGTAPWQTSTLQLIVPNTGVAEPVFLDGGPGPRDGRAMVQSDSSSTFADRVWVFGGSSSGLHGTTYFNDVWELSDTGFGGELAWRRLPPNGPAPPGRRDAAVSYRPGHATMSNHPCLIVAGGANASGALNDTWSFDLVSRTWALMTTTGGLGRTGAAITYDQNTWSNVMVGGSQGTTTMGDIWEYGGTNYWINGPTPQQPRARRSHAMVYDRANHRTLVFGGDIGSSVALADMWGYDGSAWQPLVGQGEMPKPRKSAAVCYDEAHQATVLFGGNDGLWQPLGDTHVLSSNGFWTTRSAGPAQRAFAAMTYVPSQQRSLLFGGQNPAVLGDTWLYHVGTDQWQQLAIPSPPARSGHAMVHDRLRDRVVLFGGYGLTGYLDDTWEYHASTGWVARNPTNKPPRRLNHQMAYDETRARTVVFGGDGFTGMLADVWEWNGTEWQERAPESFIGTRRTATLVYDADRRRLVMFGGEVSPNGFLNEIQELTARIDRVGPGNTAVPQGLRYYSQPALGQQLQLGFANPNAYGFYTMNAGPVQQPMQQYAGSPFCEATSMYAAAYAGMVYGTSEPNLVWTVPNSPTLLGTTSVFQAFAYQVAGCWRATDALHVRF